MQIPQKVEIALNSKENNPKTVDRYWWWMVYGKSARGLPTLKRTKPSKK